MATSSITHNFVISNPESVRRFVSAIEEAEYDRTPKRTLPGRQLTDSNEILALTYIGEDSLYELLSDFSVHTTRMWNMAGLFCVRSAMGSCSCFAVCKIIQEIE